MLLSFLNDSAIFIVSLDILLRDMHWRNSVEFSKYWPSFLAFGWVVNQYIDKWCIIHKNVPIVPLIIRIANINLKVFGLEWWLIYLRHTDGCIQ